MRYSDLVAKDRDMEWRLVATKGRESCRWQAADTSWVALSLGYQGDITKVVVTASDGRSETVDGYEQGLNLARRWRTEWQHDSGGGAMSSKSGPWLPPLPGYTDPAAGGSADDLSPAPIDSHMRSSLPPTAPNPATSPGSVRHRSVPPAHPHSSSPSPAPTRQTEPPSPGSIHSGHAGIGSRVSQKPLSRASHSGIGPLPSFSPPPAAGSSTPSSPGGSTGNHPPVNPANSNSGLFPVPRSALRNADEPEREPGAKPDSNPPKFPRR